MGWVTVANVPVFLSPTNARYYPEYIMFGGYTVHDGFEASKQG